MKHPFPKTDSTEPSARDKFRAALREQCIAGGFPLDTLDETIDLAMHATDEAMASARRVISTGTNGVVILQAAPIAFQLIAQEAQGSAEGLTQLLKATGDFQSFEAEFQP